MTRDDIIRMAREAGFRVWHIELYGSDPMPFVAPCSATDCMPELERFAALVAAAERAKLYARPGAQSAPSQEDESVRKSWARFSNELHRSPDAPYPGMADAFEQHFSQSFIDREWRAEAATWAAAWKAAKRHFAQPAPSVPDDVMRDAKRYRFLRAAKNIPISTEAARDPIVYDAAIDAAMLAAAPEAQP